MEDNAREFGLFIDGLRIERQLSRESLCEGIMSLSQYKRYLRGDTSIPNNKLLLLADRLKFSISDLHIMYRSRQDTQFKKIGKINKLIRERQYRNALDSINKMKSEVFISDYNKLYFDYCYITVQYNLKLVSDVHVLGMLSNLIDYPDCMKNESFTWLELSILFYIVIISSQMENYEPSERMYEILTSSFFQQTVLEESSLIPLFYSTLSQIMGAQKRYKEVIELTSKGIDYCLRLDIFTGLPRLFLFNSFANYDLDNCDLAIKNAKKAFMILYVENKEDIIEQFRILFENKFDKKLEELIQF